MGGNLLVCSRLAALLVRLLCYCCLPRCSHLDRSSLDDDWTWISPWLVVARDSYRATATATVAQWPVADGGETARDGKWRRPTQPAWLSASAERDAPESGGLTLIGCMAEGGAQTRGAVLRRRHGTMRGERRSTTRGRGGVGRMNASASRSALLSWLRLLVVLG